MHHQRQRGRFFDSVVAFMVFLLLPMFSATSKPLLFSVDSALSLEVGVLPPLSNVNAEYTFTYFPQKKLEVHDWILLRFPVGARLQPPIPDDPGERARRLAKIIEAITVRPLFGADYCFSNMCSGLPIVTINSDQSMDIRFNSEIAIDPAEEKWSKATVIVSPEAGIVTPPKAGSYSFGLSTIAEPKLRESLSFTLEDFMLSPAKISLQDSRINQTTHMTLEFSLKPPRIMYFEKSFFRIDFPEGTRILTRKEDYRPGWIKLNELALPYIKELGGNYMVLPIPTPYHESTQNILHIDQRMGLINPFKPGEYQLKLATQYHVQAISSEVYEITIPKNQGILSVNPAITESIAEYSISFFPQKKFLSGDKISILFPDTVWVPSTLSREHVRVNGQIPRKAEVNLNIIEQTVDIILSHGLSAENGVEICINKDARIRNPKQEEQLSLGIHWQGVPIRLNTLETPIKAQKLEVKNVYIEKPYAGTKSLWRIEVIFGKNRAPSVGERIVLKLPFEENWRWIPITKQAPEMEILLEDVIVPEPGNYRLLINTPQECKERILSPEFSILPALPKTTLHFRGGTKGNNGWYQEPPKLRFEKQDPAFILHIYWGGKYLLNNPEVTFDTDKQQKRIITWQSIAPWGAEELQSMEIKIDPIPPSFEVFNLKEDPFSTDQEHFTFNGQLKLEELSINGKHEQGYFFTLYLNGEKVDILQGKFQIKRSLEEGENLFHFLAEDEAGNKSEKTYTIIREAQALSKKP